MQGFQSLPPALPPALPSALPSATAPALPSPPPTVILWTTCERLLRKASRLMGSNDKRAGLHIQECIAAAIRCLEAVLLIPQMTQQVVRNAGRTGLLSPRDEIKTRCKMAEILLNFTNNQLEADTHIQKALLLTTKISHVDPLKYSVFSLQLVMLRRSNMGAARYALRQILSDVELQGFPQWYYYFIGQQISFALEEEDYPAAFGALSAAAQEAERRNDLLLMLSFCLRRATLSLWLSDFQQTSATLSSIAPLFSPNENGEENPDPSLIHFRFVFHMVNVLFLMNTGKAYEARQALMRLQDVVTKSTVPIDNNGMLESLDGSRMLGLVFLVSALVWKCNDRVKSLEYLQEGSNTLAGVIPNPLDTLSLKSTVESRQKAKETELVYLSLLGEIKVLCGEYNDAMNAFFNATDLLQSSPSLEKLYKKVLLLDLGLCFQSMGDFSTAFRFLFGVESMSRMGDAGRDFASAVNRIMLCSGGVDGIPVQYVEGFEAGHKDMMPSSEMLRESLLGVKAVKSEEAQTTKVHFLEVARKGDKGSSLFKALSLVFLGGSFLDTNAVQAKKMFNMAKDVAVRCQFQLLAAFAHLGLKEVAIKEGVMEAVKAHDHGIQMHLQAYDVNVSASIPSPLKAH